jgi:hypothetical protein
MVSVLLFVEGWILEMKNGAGISHCHDNSS